MGAVRVLRGWLLLLCVLLRCAPWMQAQGDAPGTVMVPDAQWRLFSGESCALPGDSGCVPLPQSEWELTRVSHFWLRAEVTLPDAMRSGQPLQLLVQCCGIYRVYVNGVLVGGSGDWRTHRGPLLAISYSGVPASAALGGKLTIAEDVQLTPATELTPGLLPVRVGPAPSLQVARKLDVMNLLGGQWFHLGCYLLVFCAGLFFLLLFSSQQRPEYLALAVLLVALASLRLFEFGAQVNLGLGTRGSGLDYVVCNVLLGVVQIELLFALMRRPVTRLFRWVEMFFLLSSGPLLLLLLPWPEPVFARMVWLTGWIQTPLLFALPLCALLYLLPLRACWRSREPEMRWIGGALLFIAFEECNRYLGQMGFPSFPQDVLVHGVDVDLRGLSFLLFAVGMMAALTMRHQRVDRQKRAMEGELEAARQVQEVLVPSAAGASAEHAVAGLVIESVYKPASSVGGDFFQIIPLPGGGAVVAIGDVSGKGMQAAMTVSLLVGALRTLAETTSSPAAILDGLNRRLEGRGAGFTTCLVLCLGPDGRVQAANAGHLSPYLNGAELPLEAGLPLGFGADAGYEEQTFQVAAGSRLTLLTDGVVEAMNSRRELFGFGRTAAVSGQGAAEIADAAERFGRGVAQADDMTVLTLWRVGV